jgi:arsenate reductase
MAEVLLRYCGEDQFEVFSAGTSPSRVHPMAVEVMAEKGIDLTGQQSKSLDQFLEQGFDFIITTCDDAQNKCPAFPGRGKTLHWGLEDPAAAEGILRRRRGRRRRSSRSSEGFGMNLKNSSVLISWPLPGNRWHWEKDTTLHFFTEILGKPWVLL